MIGLKLLGKLSKNILKVKVFLKIKNKNHFPKSDLKNVMVLQKIQMFKKYLKKF
jgi:hypothetical protein